MRIRVDEDRLQERLSSPVAGLAQGQDQLAAVAGTEIGLSEVVQPEFGVRPHPVVLLELLAEADQVGRAVPSKQVRALQLGAESGVRRGEFGEVQPAEYSTIRTRIAPK